MGAVLFKQARCSYGYSGKCQRANGLSFLVVEFLPWTVIGMCRECAVEVKPDLIWLANKAALAGSGSDRGVVPANETGCI
ncbi:hypothetical protein PSEMO_53260 [Pseudomonas putida]|uniref:Uncharacterized protein n=1 Tax=Pseudomonas putida TaxID=303 RepID=A0A1Q9QY22_PSEPU|nr:hypothetical protein PSEMO_53260 [Pseudomonas putida]